MSYHLLRSLIVFAAMTFSLHLFAKVELSLLDLREEVLKENIDIRIQYENYYQAQKGVSVALGQFLPSANINMININTTLAILQSTIPTPSNWFAYQSSKELKIAEKFTTETIKLNILEGLTITFINLKHHEALLKSLQNQEKTLVHVFEEAKKKEELGLATAHDVFMAHRNLLQHRQDIYSLSTLILTEKQSMLIALNKNPNEELVLGDLLDENLEAIPSNYDEGAKFALMNSTELLSNSYQAEAAKFMVKSKVYSFISFNGIGFGYGSAISIEKSKERVIKLQGDQIAIKIKNQVYSAYESINYINQRIELQKQVIESVKKTDDNITELYLNNLASFSQYYQSKNNLASEKRGLIKLQMERRMKIAQLKRLLGLDSSLNGVDLEKYQELKLKKYEKHARKGYKHIWISLQGDKELLKDVFSVTYSVENIFSDYRMLAGESSLTVYFKGRYKSKYKVVANIQLISGDVLKQEMLVEVQ